jgi:hypothetical protein
VIYDPFPGSGTTVGEGLKLGARAIGRESNPVVHLLVRNASGVHRRRDALETFRAIESDVTHDYTRAPICHQTHRRDQPGQTPLTPPEDRWGWARAASLHARRIP